MKRHKISMDIVKENWMPYLLESFEHPMGKYPQGRLTTKITNWKVLGGTVDPMKASYLNWTGISSIVPDLRVVYYWRSNKVKHAVSSIRAMRLMRNCGMMVL